MLIDLKRNLNTNQTVAPDNWVSRTADSQRRGLWFETRVGLNAQALHHGNLTALHKFPPRNLWSMKIKEKLTKLGYLCDTTLDPREANSRTWLLPCKKWPANPILMSGLVHSLSPGTC